MEARIDSQGALAHTLRALRGSGVTLDGALVRYDFARIARETGVSRSQISQFCNGRMKLNPGQEERLRRFAGDVLARAGGVFAFPAEVPPEAPAGVPPQPFERNPARGAAPSDNPTPQPFEHTPARGAAPSDNPTPQPFERNTARGAAPSDNPTPPQPFERNPPPPETPPEAPVAVPAPPQTPPPPHKTKIELYQTAEFVEAVGLLDWTMRNRKMCVMTGYPGVGKTTALREYARREPGAHVVTCRPTMRMRDMLDAVADALGIEAGGGCDERVRRIQRALASRRGDMLIFDEADHLYGWDVKKFEVIRQIWDETGVPTVLAGPPRLEELLTRGGGRQNLSQLYRRKFEIRLRGIGAEEALAILSGYDVEPEAARALAAVAADARHGGMGNFVEIFGLCLDAARGGRVTRAIFDASKCYKLRG